LSALSAGLFLLGLLVPRANGQTVDRAVTAVVLDRTASTPGETLNVTVTVRNVGTNLVGMSVVQIGLQVYGAISAVTLAPLIPGAQVDVPFVLQIPATALKGTYFVEGCAFSLGGEVPEATPGNNCLKTPLTIDSPNFVDMRAVSASAIQTPVTQTVPFPVDVQITNLGNVAAFASISVLLSTDSIITPSDLAIGFGQIQLSAGESRTVTIQATAPDDPSRSSGYLGACVTSSIQTDYENDCIGGGLIQLVNPGPQLNCISGLLR